ncbi:MAG: hypothetical protein LBQ69_02015 [Treponema sp.]|jgi:hypothetical protein|nr:hypothetical protein [Treponema sp.]
MKRLAPFLLLAAALFAGCASPPAPVEEHPPAEPDVAIEAEEPELEPDGLHGASSQEVYRNTLAEVQKFIDNLNQTIRRKDFPEWRNALSDEYFEHISSREFLAQATESPALRRGRIVLRTANDYFFNVVVPSRTNSRVDEIELENDNKVRVYHIETRSAGGDGSETRTRRLRLYELVKIDNNWKISN